MKNWISFLILASACMCGVLRSSTSNINDLIPNDVLSPCLLLAASGDDGTPLNDLKLVCSKWRSIVNDKQMNKHFMKAAQIYYIYLPSYKQDKTVLTTEDARSKIEDAKSKIATDLAQTPIIRHLVIEGENYVDLSPSDYCDYFRDLSPRDIFPQLFLG